MEASRGYSKEDYKKAPVNLEFPTIDAAAEYLAAKHDSTEEAMRACIQDDTNCDAVVFEDGSVILNEYTDCSTGNNIKKYRIKAGLTQAQLAGMIGKPQQHVSRWEKGTRVPSVPALLALSRALNCSVGDLIEE